NVIINDNTHIIENGEIFYNLDINNGTTIKITSKQFPIQVLNNANFSGTLTIDLNGYTPSDGEIMDLINYNSSSGNFDSVTTSIFINYCYETYNYYCRLKLLVLIVIQLTPK